MRRMELLQEIRKMRFEAAYERWNAGQLLGMCERTFRRCVVRYEAEGLDELIDQRREQG